MRVPAPVGNTAGIRDRKRRVAEFTTPNTKNSFCHPCGFTRKLELTQVKGLRHQVSFAAEEEIAIGIFRLSSEWKKRAKLAGVERPDIQTLVLSFRAEHPTQKVTAIRQKPGQPMDGLLPSRVKPRDLLGDPPKRVSMNRCCRRYRPDGSIPAPSATKRLGRIREKLGSTAGNVDAQELAAASVAGEESQGPTIRRPEWLLLSGAAPSVPGNARAVGESSGRTQSTSWPAALGAAKGWVRPSGESAGAGTRPNCFSSSRSTSKKVSPLRLARPSGGPAYRSPRRQSR